jgi:hypothetical protein
MDGAIEHVAAALGTSGKEDTALRPALSNNLSSCLDARSLTAPKCTATAASAQNPKLFRPLHELCAHWRMQQQQLALSQGVMYAPAGTGTRDCAQAPLQCLRNRHGGNLMK